MNERYYIPKYLDVVPRFLIWPVDDWLVVGSVFVLCTILQHYLIGIIISLIARKAWVALKRGEEGNPLILIGYWYLPDLVKIPGIPASYHRVFVG